MSINGGRVEWSMKKVASFLRYAGIGAMAIAMLLTTVDATLRYGFHSGIPASYHLTEYLLVAMIALPLAQTQIEKAHVRVDLFITRIHGRAFHIIEFTTILFALILFALATYFCGKEAIRAFIMGDYEYGIINYPKWPAKWFIPIGTGAFCLSLLVDVVHHARAIFKR